MSPSIYDTAQLARFAPPTQGVQPILDWLLSQQSPDGGWGEAALPLTRDVPTLAAILALQHYADGRNHQTAIEGGLEYLRWNARNWSAPLGEGLPVAVELVLPHLLTEASRYGLELPLQPYAELIALGQRRRQLLSRLALRPGTPPYHSWEAWGQDPAAAPLDGVGSIGHSPAATAFWLQQSQGRSELSDARAAAQAYLQRANDATGSGIPGLVPTVWPIALCEQITGLYALAQGGILALPEIYDDLWPHLQAIASRLSERAVIGMCDDFAPDGDDTAMAIAALSAADYQPAGNLRAFETAGHYCAYPGELQPSLTVTVHALHALQLQGDTPQNLDFVLARQLGDGRWNGDKWNISWVYGTAQALIALAELHEVAVIRGVEALLHYQHDDGGWGIESSTVEETAYALLALLYCQPVLGEWPVLQQSLQRGSQWLIKHYRTGRENGAAVWLGKEVYRVPRIARAFSLSALLACQHAGYLQPAGARHVEVGARIWLH